MEKHARWRVFWGLVCWSLSASIAEGRWEFGTRVGGMQQPASQYFLFTYGGYGEWLPQNSPVRLWLGYFERPKFVSHGFAEQESGGIALIGGRLAGSRVFDLNSYIGFGSISGYIANLGGAPEESGTLKRYRIHGPALAASASFYKGHFRVGLSHDLIIGIVDDDELEVRVTWPFRFINVFTSIGF